MFKWKRSSQIVQGIVVQVLPLPAKSPVVVEKRGLGGMVMEGLAVEFGGLGVGFGVAGLVTDLKPSSCEIDLEIRKAFVRGLRNLEVTSGGNAVLLQKIDLSQDLMPIGTIRNLIEVPLSAKPQFEKL
jgi:hypothetical protein